MPQPEYPPGQLYRWADVYDYAVELDEIGLDYESLCLYLAMYGEPDADDAMDFLTRLALEHNYELMNKRFPIAMRNTTDDYLMEPTFKPNSGGGILGDIDEMITHFSRTGNEKQRNVIRRLGKVAASMMLAFVGYKMMERSSAGSDFLSSDPETYVSELATVATAALVYIGSVRYFS